MDTGSFIQELEIKGKELRKWEKNPMKLFPAWRQMNEEKPMDKGNTRKAGGCFSEQIPQ